MSEMVERVAKAVRDAANDASREETEYCSVSMSVAAARTAIAAMREPTNGMEDAGIAAPDDPSCGHEWIINPGRIWQAMIDEALK